MIPDGIVTVGEARWLPPRHARRTLRYRLGLRRRPVASGWGFVGWHITHGGPWSADELARMSQMQGRVLAPGHVLAKLARGEDTTEWPA